MVKGRKSATSKSSRGKRKASAEEEVVSSQDEPSSQDDESDHDLLVQVKPSSIPTKNVNKKLKHDLSESSFPVPGEPDGLGGLDQGATYVVEYSKTSRATCKRCDIRLKKGELRVGHRPLFRGKPGYQVFKHLQCIVFSEDILCAEDVAGYDQLTDEDYCKLASRIHSSQDEIKKESQELEPDELVQKQFTGEMRETPKHFIGNLLPFQIEGLSWMYNQEVNMDHIRGGILADEMGMGKTIQTIATILDNRPKLQRSVPGSKHPSNSAVEKLIAEESLWDASLAEWKKEMIMNDVHESILPKAKKGQVSGGARAGTLVVCPVIALSQWKSEIEKFCESNSLSVVIYHGPDRAKLVPRDLLVQYDVVLTTYQVIEADFRRMISPNRVRCPNCNAKFKVDKLHIHLKYFCGEYAQRTDAQSRTVRQRDRRDDSGSKGKKGSTINKKESQSTQLKHHGNVTKPASKKSIKKNSVIDNSKQPVNNGRRKSARGAALKARKSLYFKDDSDDDSSSSEYEDDEEEDTDSSSSESTESPAIKKARLRQVQALQQLKEKSKTASETKHFKEDEKKFAKKKVFSHSGGDSDDEDDISNGFNGINDVDMNELIKEAMKGAQMSPLHSVCWWRVVLDEAHFIKSRSSQTSASAFALTGIHRWCLSGTPLQNRVGEFYSLVRFLRLDPMAHYMCRGKDCTCKSIHYRMMNGKCKDCGHGSIQHYSHFNKHILNPIQRDGYAHDGRRAMFTLKNEILDKCLLRRTKETRADDMNLPPRIVTIKPVRLHPIEEDFYNALYTQTSSSFNDYVADGTLLNNYAHIFDLLMRMRQAVSHPYLVIHSNKGVNSASPVLGNGSTDCSICHETATERVISTCCNSCFCRSCVIEYTESAVGDTTYCPNCTDPLSIDLNDVRDDILDDSTLTVKDSQNVSCVGLPSLKELPHVATGSILRKIDLKKFATSSKIEHLCFELVEMRRKSPGSKAIVFSQFVNMLDLVRWRLHSDPLLVDLGLGARAIHGGMDAKSRDEVLKDFRENPSVRVLLMSLKAGGVALNLTVANYIFLLDPWWNPAAEMQAIDRTHRLGQYRPIRAIRFIAENTVEERILQLQEKKRLVFDGTVGRDAGSLKMLTVDDMKSLFS